MKKNKLLTKDQISEKYKKMRIAAIVGYCLNALLLLLIVLSMVFGSNNASSVSAQNENQTQLVRKNSIAVSSLSDYNVYNLKYSGIHTFTLQELMDFNEDFDISNIYSETSQSDIGRSLSLQDFYVSYNNELTHCTFGHIVFSSYYADGVGWYYRLNYVVYLTDNNQWLTAIYKRNELGTDYNYTFTSLKVFVCDDTLDSRFSLFYEKVDSSTFSFNSSFNFNAPFGGSLNNKFVTISDTETIHRVTYDTGIFLSNGRLYDQIKLVYWHASVYLFMTEDGSYELGPQNMYTFTEMYYHPYGASDSATQLVCSRDSGNAYISGSWTPYMLQSVTWQNDEFRHILFLQNISDDLITDINAFNNNTDVSINNYNSGSFLNVFTLVASALTGLMPILNMVILPGVTIGILLFIPLVAMLVFAIIRIIKK